MCCVNTTVIKPGIGDMNETTFKEREKMCRGLRNLKSCRGALDTSGTMIGTADDDCRAKVSIYHAFL